MRMTLTELTSILGMWLGTAGFVMSMMNYLRDRPKVKVTLRWELTEVGTDKAVGIVRVTNVLRMRARNCSSSSLDSIAIDMPVRSAEVGIFIVTSGQDAGAYRQPHEVLSRLGCFAFYARYGMDSLSGPAGPAQAKALGQGKQDYAGDGWKILLGCSSSK
jgi:hypothetical protein